MFRAVSSLPAFERNAVLIGIAGSLLATYGGQALGLYQAGQAAGFIGSLIGAIILLESMAS